MVFRVATLHLVDGADLQVVLQVGAHAGQVQPHINAMLAQQRRRPMPDSCRICGEFTAPALRMTSCWAWAVTISSPVHTCTPVQRRLPSACVFGEHARACADVQSSKLGRL